MANQQVKTSQGRAEQRANAPRHIGGLYDVASGSAHRAAMLGLVGTVFTSYVESAPLADIVAWQAELT